MKIFRRLMMFFFIAGVSFNMFGMSCSWQPKRLYNTSSIDELEKHISPGAFSKVLQELKLDKSACSLFEQFEVTVYVLNQKISILKREYPVKLYQIAFIPRQNNTKQDKKDVLTIKYIFVPVSINSKKNSKEVNFERKKTTARMIIESLKKMVDGFDKEIVYVDFNSMQSETPMLYMIKSKEWILTHEDLDKQVVQGLLEGLTNKAKEIFDQDKKQKKAKRNKKKKDNKKENKNTVQEDQDRSLEVVQPATDESLDNFENKEVLYENHRGPSTQGNNDNQTNGASVEKGPIEFPSNFTDLPEKNKEFSLAQKTIMSALCVGCLAVAYTYMQPQSWLGERLAGIGSNLTSWTAGIQKLPTSLRNWFSTK